MKEKQKNQYDDTLVNNEIKLHLKFSGAVRQELHFNAITCALLYQGSPLAVEGNMLHFKGRTVQLGFYPVGVQRHSGALRHGSAILLLPDLGEAAGCAAGPIGNPHREVPRGAAVRADWEQRAPRGSRAIRRGAAVRL